MNPKKLKRSGRKRKIFLTIALGVSLVVGKPRLSSSRSSSSNFGNQTVGIERVVETSRGGFKPDPNQGQSKKVIVYRIEESPALVREAERMCKNQKTQIEANQLSLGNRNPGIGSKSLKGCGNGSYLRVDKRARIFYRKTKEGREILGKANKKNGFLRTRLSLYNC